MKEKFKDVKNYEGLYQISNLGNVKSLPRFHKTNINGELKGYIDKEKILKKQITKKGYEIVYLTKNKKTKYKFIHRLIAEAFLKNPNNYNCINHKDGNKLNNNVENLEWCTYKHNIQHAYNNNLMKNNKIVYQYNLDNNFIKKYYSINKASIECNINQGNISSCCKGKRKTAGGYIWRF